MNSDKILKDMPFLQSIPTFLSACTNLYNKNQEFRFIEKMELDEKLGNLEVGTAFPLKEIYEYRLKIYRQHLLAIQGSFGFISLPMLYTLLLLFLDFYTWGLSFIRDLYKYYSRYGLKFDNDEFFLFTTWYVSANLIDQLVDFFDYEGWNSFIIPPGTVYLLPVLQSIQQVRLIDKELTTVIDRSKELSLLNLFYKRIISSSNDFIEVIFYCCNNIESFRITFLMKNQTLTREEQAILILIDRFDKFSTHSLFILRLNDFFDFADIRTLKKLEKGPAVDIFFNNYLDRVAKREFLHLTGISPYEKG